MLLQGTDIAPETITVYIILKTRKYRKDNKEIQDLDIDEIQEELNTRNYKGGRTTNGQSSGYNFSKGIKKN